MAAKTSPPVPLAPFIEDLNDFTNGLRSESDRGAALVGMAYLDELIHHVIGQHMIDEPKRVKELLDYPGPLSTAASKIDLAYTLGWIGPQVRDDLCIIRKIRNEFAHSHKTLTFDDPAISRLCGKLKALEFVGLRFAVMALTLQLAELYKLTPKPSRGVDVPVRSIPGLQRKRTD